MTEVTREEADLEVEIDTRKAEEEILQAQAEIDRCLYRFYFC